MGHHIAEDGTFRSDKYPSLPPDKVALSLKDPRASEALCAAAKDYLEADEEFAIDLGRRLVDLHDDVYETTLECKDGKWRFWETQDGGIAPGMGVLGPYACLDDALEDMGPTAVVTAVLRPGDTPPAPAEE